MCPYRLIGGINNKAPVTTEGALLIISKCCKFAGLCGEVGYATRAEPIIIIINYSYFIHSSCSLEHNCRPYSNKTLSSRARLAYEARLVSMH